MNTVKQFLVQKQAQLQQEKQKWLELYERFERLKQNDQSTQIMEEHLWNEMNRVEQMDHSMEHDFRQLPIKDQHYLIEKKHDRVNERKIRKIMLLFIAYKQTKKHYKHNSSTNKRHI